VAEAAEAVIPFRKGSQPEEAPPAEAAPSERDGQFRTCLLAPLFRVELELAPTTGSYARSLHVDMSVVRVFLGGTGRQPVPRPIPAYNNVFRVEFAAATALMLDPTLGSGPPRRCKVISSVQARGQSSAGATCDGAA